MENNATLHKQVVQKFLDTKTVDFVAAGKVIGELGPSLSLSEDPGDFFCATMRTFFHCYRVPTVGAPLEQLEALRAASTEL